MKFLIVGDSQAAGPPGRSAQAHLVSLRHQVRRIGNSGRGPHDYVRMPELWSAYRRQLSSFRPDHVLLIFGSNDPAGDSLIEALRRIRRATASPVWLSGPPHYGDAAAQRRGEGIRANYVLVFADGRYIDAYPWTQPGVARTPDGLHFTSESGAAWGIPLVTELLRRIAQLTR